MKQELQPLKTGNSLTNALAEKQIRHHSDLEPLKSALRYVMVLVGLRGNNLPNEEEKAVLINHILKHYSGHTPAEIRLAFEKAINGDFGIDVNPYENFSVMYFSKIMNEYRNWAHENYTGHPFQRSSLPSPSRSREDEQRETAEWNYQMWRRKIDFTGVENSAEILRKDRFLKEGELVIDFYKRWGKEHIYVQEVKEPSWRK